MSKELIAKAREWERDWGERRTSGLITSLASLAERQASDLSAANASILKLRAEVVERGEELARIKGAALAENMRPIEGRHGADETLPVSSAKIRTDDQLGACHADRATLLDAVRVLTADAKEYQAESIQQHCEWVAKRTTLYAAIDKACKEAEQLRSDNRQLAENAQIATDSLLRRTQELAAAEEALRFKTAEADTLRKNRDALAHGETEALKMMAAEKERADKHAKAESFWIEERNRSERLYLAAGKKLATYERVIDVVRKMKVRKAEMDNDPTLRDLLQQNTILYPFVECLNSMEIPE